MELAKKMNEKVEWILGYLENAMYQINNKGRGKRDKERVKTKRVTGIVERNKEVEDDSEAQKLVMGMLERVLMIINKRQDGEFEAKQKRREVIMKVNEIVNSFEQKKLALAGLKVIYQAIKGMKNRYKEDMGKEWQGIVGTYAYMLESAVERYNIDSEVDERDGEGLVLAIREILRLKKKSGLLKRYVENLMEKLIRIIKLVENEMYLRGKNSRIDIQLYTDFECCNILVHEYLDKEAILDKSIKELLTNEKDIEKARSKIMAEKVINVVDLIEVGIRLANLYSSEYSWTKLVGVLITRTISVRDSLLYNKLEALLKMKTIFHDKMENDVGDYEFNMFNSGMRGKELNNLAKYVYSVLLFIKNYTKEIENGDKKIKELVISSLFGYETIWGKLLRVSAKHGERGIAENVMNIAYTLVGKEPCSGMPGLVEMANANWIRRIEEVDIKARELKVIHSEILQLFTEKDLSESSKSRKVDSNIKSYDNELWVADYYFYLQAYRSHVMERSKIESTLGVMSVGMVLMLSDLILLNKNEKNKMEYNGIWVAIMETIWKVVKDVKYIAIIIRITCKVLHKLPIDSLVGFLKLNIQVYGSLDVETLEQLLEVWIHRSLVEPNPAVRFCIVSDLLTGVNDRFPDLEAWKNDTNCQILRAKCFDVNEKVSSQHISLWEKLYSNLDANHQNKHAYYLLANLDKSSTNLFALRFNRHIKGARVNLDIHYLFLQLISWNTSCRLDVEIPTLNHLLPVAKYIENYKWNQEKITTVKNILHLARQFLYIELEEGQQNAGMLNNMSVVVDCVSRLAADRLDFGELYNSSSTLAAPPKNDSSVIDEYLAFLDVVLASHFDLYFSIPSTRKNIFSTLMVSDTEKTRQDQLFDATWPIISLLTFVSQLEISRYTLWKRKLESWIETNLLKLAKLSFLVYRVDECKYFTLKLLDTINTSDFSMDKDFSVTYNNIIEVVEFVESSNFLKTDLDFYETFISRLQSNVLENRILQIEKRLGSQVEYKKTFSTEKILVKTRRDVFGYDNTKMKHEQEMLANLNTKSIIPIVDKFNVLQGQFYHDLNAYNNNNEFLLQEINDDNLLNLENSRLFVDSIQKIESFSINQAFYNLSNSTAIKLAKDQTNLYNSKNYAAQLIMDNSNSNRHTNGYNNMIKYDQMVVEKLYQISSNYSALRVGETNIGSIGGISTEASTSTDQVALAVLRLKAGGMLWNLGNTVDDVSEFLKKSGVSTNQIWNESLFEIGNKPSAVIESTVSQGKRKEFTELISESKDDDSFLEYYSKLGLSGYYYCKSESNIQDENCDSSELVGKSMQLLTSLLEKYKNDMSKKRQLSSRIYKMMTSSTKLQFQPNPKDYSLLGWVVGMDAFIPQLVAALNHHNAVIAENIYNLLLAMLNLSDELIDKSLIHLISTELSNAASLHYSSQSRWIRLLLDYIKTKDGYINVLNNTQTFVAESSKMMELEEEKIERLLVKYHQLLSSQPIPGKCMDTAKIYDAIEEQVKFILYGAGSDPNNESSTLKTKTLILKSNRNQTFTSKFGLRLLEAVHKSKENNDWNCDDGLGKLHSEIFTYINVNNNTEVKNLSNFLFSACWYSQQYMYITLPLDNSYNYYGADNLIRFCGVGKHVTILPTKTRPKKITFFSIDGYQIEFILKGNEDLRADYSILSIWNLLNTELFSSPKQGFSTFGVLPMGRSGGYVEVIPDIFPLFDLYKSHYKTTGGSFLSPAKVHANVKSKLTNPNDLYSELANTCPDNLLLNHVLRMSKNLAHYYLSAKSLAISAGIISLFGYLVGLGDRHLDNILLLNNNQFVLIDLNVCFDKSGLLAVPETVPFRLTRNISHFIDSTFAKLYPRVMTKLLLSIRSNPNLGILVESFGLKCLEFDPLSDWLKMHSLKTTPNNTTDAFVTKNVDNFNLDDCKSFDELASAVRVYTRRLCLGKGTLASHLDYSNLIPLVPSILVNSGKASSPNTSSVSASPSPCSMNEPSSSLLLDDCLNFARLVGVSNTLRTGSKFKDLTLAIQHNSADNLVNVERIVENLISCATSEKNLVKMYAGWSFWF